MPTDLRICFHPARHAGASLLTVLWVDVPAVLIKHFASYIASNPCPQNTRLSRTHMGSNVSQKVGFIYSPSQQRVFTVVHIFYIKVS